MESLPPEREDDNIEYKRYIKYVKNIILDEFLNLKKLNHLNLNLINYNIFPSVKVLKNLPEKISLFETVVVTINDHLVELFLNKKIKYNQLQTLLLKLIKNRIFTKYKKLKPKKIQDINFVKNNVSSFIVKTIKH